MPLRILLVDDHVLFRKGIASLLRTRPELEVIAEAGDGYEALALAREQQPDVILMDVNMPRCNGLEATRLIRQESADVPIVMLTVSDDDEDLFTALKFGASGYLLKNLEPEQLFDMLERIRQGEAPLSGTIAAKILQEFRQPEAPGEARPESIDELTSREIEVLEQVVAGATNKEIAEALFITENTVKIHLRNILEKLQVDNRLQAAVHAVREGLVDNHPDE